MHLIVHSRNVIARILTRTKENGLKSGWTCAKAHLLNTVVRLRNRSARTHLVECPCCGWQGASFRHIDCGKFTVPDAECPHCRLHERHRMLYLYLTRHTPEFLRRNEEGWVLHFAPEHLLDQFFAPNPALKVLKTDFAKHVVMGHTGNCIQSDMQYLPLQDESVRAIICLHVLEHVPSDHEGIAELHRVLRPEGEAIIMVPFMMGQPETEEYGRPIPDWFDHVRGYSTNDFKARLAPLAYEEILPGTFLSPDEVSRYKIPDSQIIYLCRKTASDN